MQKLSFDELKALYENSPCDFETYRREYLTSEIERIGAERGEKTLRALRALQWRLDVLRRRYKDPVAWNAKLSSLMHLSLSDLHAKLKELVGK